MKTLLLIRHAKSSWDNTIIDDFERPLNERGRNDAPKMANRIKDRKIAIDTFVSSPARRAKKTAELFMHEFGIKEKKLTLIPSLYEASVKNFYDAVGNLDDNNTIVALFSHNPGITDFVNTLTEMVITMPTCSIFAINIPIKKWIDFKEANKKFLFFDFPKNA
ncbi:MAG: histidine phosphatase family protein [Ginsengibacter sp.]